MKTICKAVSLFLICAFCLSAASAVLAADIPAGDINADSTVNNKDLTRLFQYLSGYDVTVVEAALDTNGDGNVNNKDLTRLFQYLSGYDVQLHAGRTLLKLKKEFLEIKVGRSSTLYLDYEGTGSLTWASSDPSVVTVTALRDSGFITAVAPGTAMVTVTDGAVSSSCTVTVKSEELQYPLVYTDETATITITKEWYQNTWCYVAHLEFTDYTRFFSECANGAYNNGAETTSAVAKRLGAIFAVNGPHMKTMAWGDRIVVRQGVIWFGAGTEVHVNGVYSTENGLLQCGLKDVGVPGIAGELVDEVVEQGLITDTFHFGVPIVLNGINNAGHDDTNRDHRTFIGTNGKPGDIWIVVSEGEYWDGESVGLTQMECAEFLITKGCTFGMALDGGGSSTMVFQGQVLNSHSRMEREVVDFLLFK